jgi:hypothetical protein
VDSARRAITTQSAFRSVRPSEMRALVALVAVLAAAPVWAMPDQGKWEFVPNEVCFPLFASAALPYLASLADKMSAIRRFLHFLYDSF